MKKQENKITEKSSKEEMTSFFKKFVQSKIAKSNQELLLAAKTILQAEKVTKKELFNLIKEIEQFQAEMLEKEQKNIVEKKAKLLNKKEVNSSLFPATYKVADKELKKVNYDFEKIVDLYENNSNIYILCYWQKSDIEKYNYADNYNISLEKSFTFPNDFDILEVVFMTSNTKKVYACSAYTEAVLYFTESDFDFVEIQDKNKNVVDVYRLANSLEFEVYIEE